MTLSFHYEPALLSHYLDLLRPQLRIAVVYGGDKDEPGATVYKTHNPRAWKSYEAVARDIQGALQELGFAPVLLLADDMRLPQQLIEHGIQLVWLNTGGMQGFHPMSHAPALLEMLGIPYIGHNPLNAALLDAKDAFKRSLQAMGIATALFITWHPAQGALQPDVNRSFALAFGEYDGPFVVKPVSGRASLHVHVAAARAELADIAQQVYDITRNTVLIEQYLPGREFCVAVAGPVTCVRGVVARRAAPFAFSAVERTFEVGETIFASMDQKPITVDRLHMLGDTEAPLRDALLELAQTIYRAFELESIVRVDVRADGADKLYVLEANPKPDLKRPTAHITSFVMAGLSAEGMRYHDLILGLLADRLHTLLLYHTGGAVPVIDLLATTAAPSDARRSSPSCHAPGAAPCGSADKATAV